MAPKYCFVVVLLLAWNTCTDCAAYRCNFVRYDTQRIDAKKYLDKCIPSGWKEFFGNLSDIKKLANDLKAEGERLNNAMEPEMGRLFKALEFVDPKDIKVVILGQDPTPQPGKATGLAFSVGDPRTVPTALNVLLEVALEGWSVNIFNGDLTKWANQGVLLLNVALTCPHGKKEGDKGHLGIWRQFTIELIEYISSKVGHSVWIIWGGEAAKYIGTDLEKRHYVIRGGHPSPQGNLKDNSFFGVNYFQCANDFLNKVGTPIDWGLVLPNYKLDVQNAFYKCPKQPVIKQAKPKPKIQKMNKPIQKQKNKPKQKSTKLKQAKSKPKIQNMGKTVSKNKRISKSKKALN